MVHNVARLVVTLSGLWLYAVCAAQKPYPRLWQYGCYNLKIYQSRIIKNTTLDFNAPGPCADFCLTSINGTFTIGLLNKSCFCLVGLSLNGDDNNHTIGCKHHCPGNPHHFCGKDNDSFSAYIVEQNQSEREDKCIAKDSEKIFEEDCQRELLICFGADLLHNTVNGIDKTSFLVQWTNISNSNNKTIQEKFDYISYPSMPYSSICQPGLWWIRAFSIYAPYVCAKPPEVENSTVTEVHGQVGDWANYTCNSGYEHAAGNLSRKCLWNGSYGSWSGNEPVCQEATKKGETTINLQNSTAPNTTPITVNVKTTTNIQNSTAPNTTPITENGGKTTTNLQNSTAPNTTPVTDNGETDKKWLILAAVTAVESIAIITMAIILVKERKNLRCCNSRVMDGTTVNGHAGQLIKVQENVEHQDLHGKKVGPPSSPEKINGHQRFNGHVNGDKIVQGHVDGDKPAQGHVDGDKPTQGHVDGDKHAQQQPPIGSEASNQAQTGSASRQLPPIGSATVQHPATGSVTGQSFVVANGFSKNKPETFGEERASISQAPESLNDDFNQDIDQHNDKQSRKSKKHPDETREERQRRKERRRLKKERKRQEEESKQSKENENEHIIE